MAARTRDLASGKPRGAARSRRRSGASEPAGAPASRGRGRRSPPARSRPSEPAGPRRIAAWRAARSPPWRWSRRSSHASESRATPSGRASRAIRPGGGRRRRAAPSSRRPRRPARRRRRPSASAAARSASIRFRSSARSIRTESVAARRIRTDAIVPVAPSSRAKSTARAATSSRLSPGPRMSPSPARPCLKAFRRLAAFPSAVFGPGRLLRVPAVGFKSSGRGCHDRGPVEGCESGRMPRARDDPSNGRPDRIVVFGGAQTGFLVKSGENHPDLWSLSPDGRLAGWPERRPEADRWADGGSGGRTKWTHQGARRRGGAVPVDRDHR